MRVLNLLAEYADNRLLRFDSLVLQTMFCRDFCKNAYSKSIRSVYNLLFMGCKKHFFNKAEYLHDSILLTPDGMIFCSPKTIVPSEVSKKL